MKLFHKIFLCFVVIFGIAFQAAGVLLIDHVYENALEQEKKYALQEFQYNKYILQSILYSGQDFLWTQEGDLEIRDSFTAPVALYDQEKNCIYSNMSMMPNVSDLRESGEGRLAFRIYQKEGESYIYVYDHVRQGESEAYLVTQTDISSVVDTQKSMTAYFQRIYLIILCIGFPLIFLLTNLLTGSIKKVSKAARRIARGKYSERIYVGTKDEIGQLAADFNQMAEKIEEKVRELSKAARAKEDFTANFAHELKTPLTSVIGYADMLYQRELPRKQVKEAAGYILHEGMRLEALSLKLMDLFVMDRQDFLLEKLDTGGLFENMRPGILPVCGKHGVKLHMDIEEAEIAVEFDLFKTMLLNIIDNAVKAECSDIRITGSVWKITEKVFHRLSWGGSRKPSIWWISHARGSSTEQGLVWRWWLRSHSFTGQGCGWRVTVSPAPRFASRSVCRKEGIVKRVSKYTWVCLLFAAVFALGSTAGMNVILQMRERQRLKESGTVVMESPVLAWQDPAAEDTATGEDDETGETKEDAERVLTVEQMEQVIKYRNHCEGEILHEPAVGQITMEEAIASGENWLVEMDFWKRQNPEFLSRRASLRVKADLSTLEVPMESWYSFWTVRFSNEYLYADLSINAVTGKVWDAEISLYGNMAHRQSFDKLELFVRLAGVQGEVEKFAQTNQSGSLVYIAVKGSQLYAEQGYYTANTTRTNEFIEDGRSTIVELHDQRVIEYRLRVEDKES